ncbi:chromosome segregation protein SMC [Jonesia quinghaiensis]|uniref:chromosome segregation protein SMC n=1 Tax=Jonesia quinghaiensis TaxID=262806 RepID=UPI0003F90010|nr:chromosome segregation protein SMC [Jonesia quinghaiensis]
MYLKTLTLRGFKSFASATRFDFEPGITCVVGPNGSGKSNVVDALAWVMGEQGAKTLRGGKMEDVIFAGTSARQALGRAEVSLTIDNADGKLPIDYAEVTITRTLFRSGGSEYAINGAPVRLLDIQELLSDTGLGREMHVIVGQGQLDTVLRATPTERRGFIEEAAGVLKHRKRKEKALRKLDNMQGNLLRLTDLLAELNKQLGPLARQAHAARRGAVFQAVARDAGLRLLADDLTHLDARLKDRSGAVHTMQAQVADMNRQLAVAREHLAEQEVIAAHASPRRSTLSAAVMALAQHHEQLKAMASLTAERLRHLGAPDQHAVIDRSPATEEALSSAQRQREALDEKISQENAELQRVTSLKTAASEALIKVETERSTAFTTRRNYEKQRDQLSADVTAARAILDAVTTDVQQAHEAVTAAVARRDDLETPGELPVLHDDGLSAVQEARSTATSIAEQLRQARGETSRAEQALARSSASVEVLTSQLRSVPDSMLDAGGVHGTLLEHVHLVPRYAPALTALFEHYLEAVVVDSPELALDIADGHPESTLTLVHPGAQIRAHASTLTQDNIEPPFVNVGALVPQIVDSQRHRGADVTAQFMQLIARHAVIAPDLEHAQQWVTDNPAMVAATMDGHLVRHGSLHLHPAQTGKVALKEQLDQHRTDIVRHERDRDAALMRQEELSRLHDEALVALKSAQDRQAEIRSQHAQATAEHQRLSALWHSASAELQRAESAVVSLVARRSKAQETLEQRTLALESLTAKPTEVVPEQDYADRISDLRQQFADVQEHETQGRVRLRALQEQRTTLHNKINSLTRALEHERVAHQRAAEQARRRSEQHAATTSIQNTVHRALTLIDRSEQHARAELAVLEESYAQTHQHIQGLRDRERDLGTALDDVRERLHREELSLSHLTAEHTHLSSQALEDFGVDPTLLVEQFGPHHDTPDYAAALRSPDKENGDKLLPFDRQRVEQARDTAQKKFGNLGKINPLALEEYKALEERHTFLAQQLDDLKRSRTDLMALVRDIDDQVRTVFLEAFEDTALQFERIFPRLFPGGTGRMFLTDPDNALTTGIEIEARPAGKKVTRISLLSGGERSLTAVALLVAIFKARPSPFYVMDEVEAALDDMNLSRLLTLFRELQEDSQLIVITHQKRTMEIADSLYGVTMHKDGISTVVTHRMDHDDSATKIIT